jgi:hypothetical protein
MADQLYYFPKVERALKSLQSEAQVKIHLIESRQYGADVTVDLRLEEFCKFFEAIIEYFNNISKQSNFVEFDNRLMAFADYNFRLLLRNKPRSFLGLFSNYIQYGLESQGKYVDEVLEMFKLLAAKIDDMLYWMSIQSG